MNETDTKKQDIGPLCPYLQHCQSMIGREFSGLLKQLLPARPHIKAHQRVLMELLPCVATYTITGKTQLVTALGTLDCFITKSTAVNEYGEGHLTSYFNEQYGFVKLEYLNIDNSQLVIDLVVCQK